VEACPTGAILFGNLADERDPVSVAARGRDTFRLLERIETEPKIHYKTTRSWIRAAADRQGHGPTEAQNG